MNFPIATQNFSLTFLTVALLGQTALGEPHLLYEQTGDVQPNPATSPTYHFMAPCGPWMGDVNGTLYHDRWFHVFYQWGLPEQHKICWGHARSRDLLSWEHLPVAIPPKGSRGSWSGGTLVTQSGPRILFTSDYQQSGASGDAELIHWTPMKKDPAMPRSLHEVKGVKIGGWRDPFLWKHEGEIYNCLGGSVSVGPWWHFFRTHKIARMLRDQLSMSPISSIASGFTDARFVEMLVAKYRSIRYAVALALADLVDDPGSSVKMDDAVGLLREILYTNPIRVHHLPLDENE